MSNVIFVRSYIRKKPASAVTYLDTTEALYPYGLQYVLARELDQVLAEPLDLVDMPEEQKQRVRESF